LLELEEFEATGVATMGPDLLVQSDQVVQQPVLFVDFSAPYLRPLVLAGAVVAVAVDFVLVEEAGLVGVVVVT